VDVGQDFSFSLILSTLYITPIFHIFEKKKDSNSFTKHFCFHSFFLNDGLFISQEKSYKKSKSNANLFHGYSIIFSLFKQFRFIIKDGKSEVFHFSRSTKNLNLSLLDLNLLEGLILQPKNNILVSYSIENFCFNNMSISVPTKLY